MIRFTKMEGLGNDFVLLEALPKGIDPAELTKILFDRHFGIGADGVIIPKKSAIADIGWDFYNSDGSTAQMCGNGMRCFARYVYDQGLVKTKSLTVETQAGIIKPEILENNNVRVNMGKPILEDAKIPFKSLIEGERKIGDFTIFPVSMGNPHCVIFTDKDPLEMAKTYGPELEVHPYFPQKTNVEFVKVLSRNEIRMCVYERGCGITLACGTGACASIVACVTNDLTNKKVKVNLLGGTLDVEWDDDLFITGAANYVFTGNYLNE